MWVVSLQYKVFGVVRAHLRPFNYQPKWNVPQVLSIWADFMSRSHLFFEVKAERWGACGVCLIMDSVGVAGSVGFIGIVGLVGAVRAVGVEAVRLSNLTEPTVLIVPITLIASTTPPYIPCAPLR